MNENQESLLLRAQKRETIAWKDLTDLYRPLILAWLDRQGVHARDLEDLSQEVLRSVVKHLPGRGCSREKVLTVSGRPVMLQWHRIPVVFLINGPCQLSRLRRVP
jgi:hypothetical protein